MTKVKLLCVDNNLKNLEFFIKSFPDINIKSLSKENLQLADITEENFNIIVINHKMIDLNNDYIGKKFFEHFSDKYKFTYLFSDTTNAVVERENLVDSFNSFPDIHYITDLKPKIKEVINSRSEDFNSSDILLKDNFSFFLNGINLEFSKTEYNIVEFLSDNVNHVKTPDEIYQVLYKVLPINNKYKTTITSHVYNIKRKISIVLKDKEYIKTFSRSGYMFTQ